MTATMNQEHRAVVEGAVQSFLAALGSQDFAALAASFSEDARLRAILPSGIGVHEGPGAIASEYSRWFGGKDPFELVTSRVSFVVDRFWVSYQLRVGFPDNPNAPHLIEQHAVGDAGPGGIERLDLVCSGFRPLPVGGSAVELFDAGSMGCGDGLAPEFRRRIQALPTGAVLRVIVRDPSAKEDLPPLARMMGHSIQSIDTLDDGRVQVDVERA
jgi:TusA-related sulfurtransferase